MFKWIKDFFTPASASFTNPNPQITDSVTQAAKPKRATAKSKTPTRKSPANKKAK